MAAFFRTLHLGCDRAQKHIKFGPSPHLLCASASSRGSPPQKTPRSIYRCPMTSASCSIPWVRLFAPVIFTFACLVACSGSEPSADAGPPRDAGILDLGTGLRDVGATDASVLHDVGPPPFRDAGVVLADVGTPRDAGAPDVGAAPIPDDCILDVTPGQHAFECDGLTFHVSVPAACANAGCGLIFDVHGLSMSGPMEENNTNLAALTQALDYVVVQPSATPNPPLASWTPSIDDDKIFDFLQRTMRVFIVDPDRVHFTGFSQGGFMTWRMLCAHPNVFASVAPAAGTDSCGGPPGCDYRNGEPGIEVPILYIHGTTDALVDFNCGQQAIDAVIAGWNLRADGVVSMDDDHRHERYINDAGTILEYITHDYETSVSSNIPLVPDLVGHCYPGSTDDGGERGQLYSFKCEGTNAFHWGERVLDFFLRTGR